MIIRKLICAFLSVLQLFTISSTNVSTLKRFLRLRMWIYIAGRATYIAGRGIYIAGRGIYIAGRATYIAGREITNAGLHQNNSS